MNMKAYYNFRKMKNCVLILLAFFMLVSCEGLLEKFPPDQLSDESFWKTESDAMLSLTAVYDFGGDGQGTFNFYSTNSHVRLDLTTDLGYEKDKQITDINNGNLTSSYGIVQTYWQTSYRQIAKCNLFMANIDKVEMDETKKEQIKGEVRFIRAFYYFWMSQLWGGVPLVTEPQTISEANNVSRNTKAEVVSFVLNELSEIANILPVTRPVSEHGRITSAAALAILGRLQMSEKMWTEAVSTYERIINMNQYELHPDYKAIFEEKGDGSSEIILSIKHMRDEYPVAQRWSLPFQFGGWGHYNPYQNFIYTYECIDGLSIKESPLYNPDEPYLNRDPRLYETIFIPEFTVWKGSVFVAHPDSSPSKYPSQLLRRDWSGYALKKYADEDFSGDVTNYGADFKMIRYAEVLLSYLESKIEAGHSIDQNLLDQTINKVRGRESVGMPAVTETDPQKLTVILRRERGVELAYEGFRLFDLFRWRIAHIVLRDKMYGMKITTDPENYTKFEVDEEGYYFVKELFFRENVDYLWPIPQREIDINSNLTQNPGY